MSDLSKYINFQAGLEEQDLLEEIAPGMEELLAEDALEQLADSFESYLKQRSALESEIVRLEGLDEESDFSFEQLNEDVREIIESVSLEDIGMESISMEAKVGGMSGWLKRFKHAYFGEEANAFRAFRDLIGTSKKGMEKYIQRFDKLQSKLDKKKDKLEAQLHKESYVTLAEYWWDGDKFPQDPMDFVERTKKVFDYVFNERPSLVEDEFKKFTKVIEKADSVDAADSQLDRVKHPADIFESGYLKRGLILGRIGFKRADEKDYDNELERLSAKRPVKITRMPDLKKRGNALGRLIPDIEFSTSEVEKLISDGKELANKTLEFLSSIEQKEKAFDSFGEDFAKAVAEAPEDLAKAASKAANNYSKHYWQPAIKFARRSLRSVRGVHIMCVRLVSVGK